MTPVNDRCETAPIAELLEDDTRDDFWDSCAAMEQRRKGNGKPHLRRPKRYSAKCERLAPWMTDRDLLPKKPPRKT